MTTHKLLLSSVAAAALISTGAFAQTAVVPEEDAEVEAVILDADGNPVEGGASANALGGQIVVEQGDAEVEVTVDDPVVTVDQARPEVLVEQAQPEITVTVAEPTVTVEQQAPIITIEQAQPEVTVRIPEPTITVRMPEPDVNVATSEPEIAVEQPQPIVRFVRPEPRITIEESEPNVQVTSAEPEIRVNRAENAAIAVEQADADVNIETEGDGEVMLSDAEPVVNVEQAEGADIQVEQADAEILIEEEGDANVNVADRGELVAGGLYAAFADARVSDLVGMNVLSETGDDVGEIDSLVMANGGLLAVVGVGGFLGLGEHEVAIPLDRFAMTDGALIVDASTEAELEGMPEWDQSGEVVPLDMTVGDAY
ncbi:PRC-barrel domain-containing protein [Jannaschia sp. S6380]|uniref:PRC-barrel domain-containing protein n=1 Tax=Jannaschia sp. S6380 TaxID=2926408 RepID=UPI001FF25ED5|nr:PRC-barrel domain-containing protein [Jannaschia sp. S6380]MCK0168850.1 PRC-barrel domain-containing protein [Jannaschia sp. S6380]